MKKLITDIDLVRINIARKDAMKMLGTFKAEDRPNALAIIEYMQKQWINAIKQSNTKVDIVRAQNHGLNDEQICEIERLEAFRDIHIKSIKDGYRDFSNMLDDLELYEKARSANDQYIAEKLAWIKHIENKLEQFWGCKIVHYEFDNISSIQHLVDSAMEKINLENKS